MPCDSTTEISFFYRSTSAKLNGRKRITVRSAAECSLRIGQIVDAFTQSGTYLGRITIDKIEYVTLKELTYQHVLQRAYL